MSEFVLPGSQPFALYGVSSMSDQGQALPVAEVAEVLPSDALQHGAYYTGQLGSKTVIARWHANKRCFVFGEYTLGSQRIRAVPHAAEGGKAEAFAPISMTQPKAGYRISEYAFETAG